ncbi:MAG TPA: MotA/TolQ/ExbB proton channel family protein [Thermoanaerobaculia bacterium]|nr:MotA/TolQ/ExbB proton channel family protein [Thermoanaerobaculia bacterium]
MNGSLNISALGELSTTGLAVIVILAVLSVWSLAVSAERLIVITRARRQSRAFARLASDHLAKGETQAVLAAAKKYPHSHLARVIYSGLATFQQKRARPGLGHAEVIEATERSLERASRLASDDLGRGLGSLATIATTAPFIGLFGTVVGIVHAFEAIALAGGAGGFSTVSQGIAEALWTTALGLVVAVPAAWMFNFLTHRIQRLQTEMVNSSSELMDFFAG